MDSPHDSTLAGEASYPKGAYPRWNSKPRLHDQDINSIKIRLFRNLNLLDINTRVASKHTHAMSDKAQSRINAIGKQLLPPINKVAPGSSKLRVEGKVVIITGIATRELLE